MRRFSWCRFSFVVRLMRNRVTGLTFATVLALTVSGVVPETAQAGSRWPGGGPGGLAGEMQGHGRWPSGSGVAVERAAASAPPTAGRKAYTTAVPATRHTATVRNLAVPQISPSGKWRPEVYARPASNSMRSGVPWRVTPKSAFRHGVISHH